MAAKKKVKNATRQFNIRLNDDDFRRMSSLAAHYAIKQSQVIRMLIKRESDRLDAVGS